GQRVQGRRAAPLASAKLGLLEGADAALDLLLELLDLSAPLGAGAERLLGALAGDRLLEGLGGYPRPETPADEEAQRQEPDEDRRQDRDPYRERSLQDEEQ